jgi:transposase
MQSKNTNSNWFDNQNIYVGLDVHKKQWTVSIYAEEFEHKTFTQPPNAEPLYNYLRRNFPGANYFSAYEAGFCGYTPHRELCSLGINNIVINAADIPSSGKEKYTKTDGIDSRKIARELRAGHLKPIHVFEPNQEEIRTLSRVRFMLVKDHRKCKNRIKSLLMYYSLHIPLEFDNNNWSKAFQDWIKNIKMNTEAGKVALDSLLDDYQNKHQQILDVTRKLRKLIKQYDNHKYMLLRSIPGIGPLTAIALIAEIGDINRFKHLKHLSSYVGFIPFMRQSDENEFASGIHFRCNSFLRPLLVESAWMAVRSDPALLSYYQHHIVNSKPSKVIIKVARKLLNRIRFVLKNNIKYQVNKYEIN